MERAGVAHGPGRAARLTRRVNERPVLLAGLGAACIATSAILVELAATGAATTAFYRCALAVPLLSVLAVAEQRQHGRRTWAARRAAWLAGLFFAVDLVLWNHAIALAGAGVATVLGNLQVLFVALAAWVLFSERPTSRLLLALPVVIVGVVLVSGLVGGPGVGNQPLGGVLFGVSTSLAYTAFLLILRYARGTPHVAGPLVDATLAGAAGSLVLGAVFGSLDLAPGWRALGWLAVLALTSQSLGWWLITSSLPRLPSAVSSLLLLLQPVIALGLAALVLAERPTPLQLFGALFILAGVLAIARRGSAAVAVPVALSAPASLRRG